MNFIEKKSGLTINSLVLSSAISSIFLLISSSSWAAEITPGNSKQNATPTVAPAKDTKTTVSKTPIRLESISVKAKKNTKTLETKHDTPAAISVVTGDTLNREIAQDYQAISKRLSNVTFNQSRAHLKNA
ncbi:MAG TPA: hypothetical protein VIZ65_08225 [Cellvibrionaceae bacterium]